MKLSGNYIRNFIFIILMCFIIQSYFGQVVKHLNIPNPKKGDTTLFYKSLIDTDNKLAIPYLVNSTEAFHFRLWANRQIIDIWTIDFITFKGLLTNYVKTYESYNMEKQDSKPSETISNQIPVEDSLAKKAFELVKTIKTIPSQDSIKGWSTGFDGIVYEIETSSPMDYSYKYYWTPSAQDCTLIEAKQIQIFVNKMKSTLNLNNEYEKFFSTLKPGSYWGDGAMIISKPPPMTEKQMKQWKKYQPQREYLDSISDSLNKYLSESLTKIFQANKDSLSNFSFYLKFSAKNRLIKVKQLEKFDDFAQKRDFNKNKKKIKKAFKQVRIDFVHSKIHYFKRLSYWDNQISVYQ